MLALALLIMVPGQVAAQETRAEAEQTALFRCYAAREGNLRGPLAGRGLPTEAASEASAWRRWTTPRPDSSFPRSANAQFSGQFRSRRWRKACSNALETYPAKRFVDIIRSVNQPQKRAGERTQCRSEPVDGSVEPWGIDVTIEFRTERMALRFEKYLKAGAGHAFASSHFADEP
jgi:hypothetical protein